MAADTGSLWWAGSRLYMHVITQHVQARESYFALLGRYAISGDYETGPMT
ncbi:MAG: hypothetical protein NXH95_14135 [Pseudomonadaceae bacterium]|nr:hypothetical protein [Pseudomonadaceae bacterium]